MNKLILKSFLFCSMSVMVLFVVRVYAEVQNPEQLFNRANSAYRSGHYQEAFLAYQDLAKLKPQADVFYNLGNAAFKTKALGIAIANYERARRLSPRDPDILENLKLAKSLVEYRVEDKRNWYHQKASELLGLARFEELLAVSLSVFLILSVLILIRIIWKQQPLFSEFSIYILWIFLILSVPVSAKLYQMKFQEQAVVSNAQVEARFAPSVKDKVAFRLTEGILVEVVDQVDSWYRILLASGDTGWVQESDIVMV